MAKSIVYTCDFLVRAKPCGAEAVRRRGAEHSLSGSAPDFVFEGDYCAVHLQTIAKNLGAMGMNVSGWHHGQKKRGMVARSGNMFTQVEARRWAREQGLEVKPRGTLPQDIIDAYAEAH